MKKFQRVALGVLGLTLIITSGCGTKTDSKKVAEEANNQNMDNKKDEKDAKFVVDAFNTNLFEVKSSELAKRKATTEDCRQLADMMITAHTKANEELTKLAANKAITLPSGISSSSQDDINSLDKQNNMDFDKKYSKMMVEGHENAIKLFESASTDCRDQDIKDWAAKMLPDLRKHLEMSKTCSDKCDHMDDSKHMKG